MSVGRAHIHYIFGLNRSVSCNVHFHDEQHILYPAGGNCVLFNTDNKSQKFISATEKCDGMTTLALSPNRRYIAIAEKGEKATITIYDLHILRKKKVLIYNDIQSEEYVSVAFSPDSKFILAQGGKPDWTLLYWSWERNKVLAVSKSTNIQSPFQPYQVSFSPKDNKTICVAGNTIFRSMKYMEGSLKTLSFQKVEPLNYVCHAWLSEERIIAGTDYGSLLLFENGEVKQEIKLLAENSSEDSVVDITKRVNTIVALSNGFVCSYGYGTAYYYEKADEIFKFKKTITIPADYYNNVDPNFAKQQIIKCLAVSPSEDILVASTDMAQLYIVTLTNIETTKSGPQIYFEVLTQMFHNAPITGLDVCIRKPLAATCSMDCSVKIWNYETCNLEVYKVFAEEALSVTLHPSGLFILVGFNDKLRLMNIFIDDIKVFREFAVKGCRECAFSNGGHMFASVMGNMIQLFSTYGFKNTINLKGHNGKVRGVVWNSDDSKLVSCGKDGAVYEWDTFTGKRIGESVLKTCMYSSVAITADGKSTFAVGSDKLLKEISESRILREVDTGDIILSSVAMSHSGRMLFAGTTRGTLLSVKYPLTIADDWNEYQGHSTAIVKIKIAFSDNYLVSTGEDGTVILWKILDKEGTDLRDTEFFYSEEILITKKDLIEKNLTVTDLSSSIQKVKTESKYQMEQNNIHFNEKMTALTETYIMEMEKMKTKNQVTNSDRDEELADHQAEMENLIYLHTEQLDEIEDTNNQKLIENFEKFQEQQARFVSMQEDYEKQLLELENSKEVALENLTDYYEVKLKDLNFKLVEIESESRLQLKESNERIKQIEEDCDRETLDNKHAYEKRLRDEKERNNTLKGDNGILKKRFNSMYKEIADLKEEIRKIHSETNRLNNANNELEKDIQILKKDIVERDSNIEFKEESIFKLKRKNQELEKFRFVLNYKIKELKEQIEPRELDIKKMKEQIQGMEMELGKFHKQIIQLELTISELKQKFKATDKDVHQERQKVHDIAAVVRRFKTELHNCVGNIQNQKLFKEGIISLYQRHVVDDITETSSFDADIQKEFTRQKEHLERSVATLRKKLIKDSEIHKTDTVKIMQENVSLIKEISDLRKELRLSRDLIHDMTAVISIEGRQKKNKPVEIARFKDKPPLIQNEIEEQKKIIEMQQMELKRLRDENYDLTIMLKSHNRSSYGGIISQL